MAFADAIAKTTSGPRAVLRIYSGSTYYRFCHSDVLFQTGPTRYDGRLIDISPITQTMSDERVCVPSCDVTLADADGYLKGLGIDQDWTASAWLVFPWESGTPQQQMMSFDMDGPPSFSDGLCHMRLVAPVSRLWGEIRLPTITSDDLLGWGAEFRSELVGVTLPAYLGDWDDGAGEIPCVLATNDGLEWFFGVNSGTGTDSDYAAADIEVFVHRRDGRRYRVPSSRWTLGSETISRGSDYPTSWNAWKIVFDSRRDVSAEDQVRVNARMGMTTGYEWTPSIAVWYAFVYWICSASGGQISTNGANSGTIGSSTLIGVEKRSRSMGLQTKFKIDQRMETSRLVEALIALTGCNVFVGKDGKLNQFLYGNDSSTTTTGGYSSYAARSDTGHCINVQRVDYDRANEAQIQAHGHAKSLRDTDAQTDASRAAVSLSYANMTQSGSAASAWLHLQQRRNLASCRRYRCEMTLAEAALGPGDVVRYTERWSGVISAPALIVDITFDLQNMKCELVLQDLTEWTDVDCYCLLDESTILRTYGAVSVAVTTANGVVTFSADPSPVDIEVGDIFETASSTNQYSAKVTVAPADIGAGVWAMTVDSVADAIEAVISSGLWYCRKSYETASSGEQAVSGFLCDETDGYFDDDANSGKVLVL